MSAADGRALGPITTAERIEALDVVRGFALIGIFLMNIEFFNRPIAALEDGMPHGLTGIDWFASWFVAYFVEGKFWTIFSLLFGMGFAVMLARAQRDGRPFIAPYVRRILALAAFGALHFILLWTGDILFSYAVAATGLLVLLYARWWGFVIAVPALVGLGFVPGLSAAWPFAGTLAFIGVIALYLRSEKRVLRLPVFSFIYAILAILGVLASIVCWALPAIPQLPAVIATTVAGFFVAIAVLSARYHAPRERRTLRLGASLYVVPALMMIVIGTVQYVAPDVDDTRPARIAEHLDQERDETRVLSSGTYREAVEMRAGQFPEAAGHDAGFAVIAIGMFLIGVWFVQTGTMKNPRAHMRLFRRLACYGLPLGIGLGLAGSVIATSHTFGDRADGYQLARALAMLGSLPASLGYVGLIVAALHSDTVFAKVRVLAPAGRMALTNYLMQSLVSTSVFYGYGGGQWGLARSWQIVFVAAVFTLQVAFSHWWLARFRYGPMEWLWRAITYRTIPEMRLRPLVVATADG